MKFQTLTNYLVALFAALLLAACGGGGAERNPNQGGPISVSPEAGTFYAGVPGTITVSGGRAPYAITSSEPGVLPVPPIVNGNSFQVIPNNPGVVDAGLQPGELQVRTVIVSVRDSTGILVSATIKVGQNFVTGYGFTVGASTCAANAPCAGGETALVFDSTYNGNLVGDKDYRIEKVRGPFQFVSPLNTNVLTDTINVRSDHNGKFTTIIRVTGGVPSQIAVIRVVDINTGASAEYNFTISSTSATASLTLIPDHVSFVGISDKFCGTGSADVYVFDGQPPYTGLCPNPNLAISPPTSTTNPGRFTVSANNNQVCLASEPCIISDNTGARVTLPVTTTRGPAAAAPPTLSVSPTSLTLACGASGSVTVIGGSGAYSANSSHPRVTAVVSGNTVTITRLVADPLVPATQQTSATVVITDGASLANVTVTIVPDVVLTGKCT